MYNYFCKIYLVLIFSMTASLCFTQELKVKNNYGGVCSLGGRSVISAFNDGKWSDVGTGAGGQFMLQFSNRVNTAWFGDYMTGTVGSIANRTDLHIGWSVMYYLVPSSVEKLPKWQPFILAGHCFDYSNLKDNHNADNFAERWSSAIQAGFGTHVNFSKRFDLILQSQYMIHLGNDIDTQLQNDQVKFIHNPGINLQGHILTSFVINYKIADLW